MQHFLSVMSRDTKCSHAKQLGRFQVARQYFIFIGSLNKVQALLYADREVKIKHSGFISCASKDVYRNKTETILSDMFIYLGLKICKPLTERLSWKGTGKEEREGKMTDVVQTGLRRCARGRPLKWTTNHHTGFHVSHILHSPQQVITCVHSPRRDPWQHSFP